MAQINQTTLRLSLFPFIKPLNIKERWFQDIAILCSSIFLAVAAAHASEHSPEISKNKPDESTGPFVFDIKPLVSETDQALVKAHQILDFDSISNLNRLYLWTTPTSVSEDDAVFEANTTLPFPLYSTFSTDHIFDSPLTPVLSPARKAIYDSGRHGFTSKIIGLYIGQNSANNIPDSDNKAGFFGFEAYSNWLINSNDTGVSSLTFELGYQDNLYKTKDLSKSVGSIITSNVILGDSGPIIGDIYYTQGFWNNKVLVHAGRLTPWYYYGYNTFTDSETDAFTSAMFSGSVALPDGGGNGSKPATSIQYFIDERFYLTSVLSNTEGKDSDFDFNIFNKEAYFLGTEFGYVSTSRFLTSRISLGVHQAKVKQSSGQRETGNGYNLMIEQELTPRRFSPYAGYFLQYEYSDRAIAAATQQISGGINITHPFHRRGDSFGWGIGTVKPSDAALRREYFSETYYRLQLTQNLQWSFDLQLYIKPSSSAHDIAPVYNTRLLFQL